MLKISDPTFDAFLSHNSNDKLIVREIASALTALGLKVWLDEEQISPGELLQDRLVEGMAQSKAAIATYGPTKAGAWQTEEMRVLLQQAVSDGKRVIPVLLPGARDKPDVPPFLAQRNWVDLRGGLTPEAVAKVKWGITGSRGAELVAEFEKLSAASVGVDSTTKSPPMFNPQRHSLDSSGQQLDQVIDESILQATIGNIRRAVDRLVEALGDIANTQQAKNQEQAIARKVICEELGRIRQLNEDQLPGPELKRLWRSHSCQV